MSRPCRSWCVYYQRADTQDTQAPALLGVPRDVTVECSSVPPPASVTAGDACDAAPTVAMEASVSARRCPSNYTLTRTWTATDNCGNVLKTSQNIHVQV